MKTVNARDLQKKIKKCVDMSQQDQVVITRRGKPAAVMVGVEGKDWEDVVFQSLAAQGRSKMFSDPNSFRSFYQILIDSIQQWLTSSNIRWKLKTTCDGSPCVSKELCSIQ